MLCEVRKAAAPGACAWNAPTVHWNGRGGDRLGGGVASALQAALHASMERGWPTGACVQAHTAPLGEP